MKLKDLLLALQSASTHFSGDLDVLIRDGAYGILRDVEGINVGTTDDDDEVEIVFIQVKNQ